MLEHFWDHSTLHLMGGSKSVLSWNSGGYSFWKRIIPLKIGEKSVSENLVFKRNVEPLKGLRPMAAKSFAPACDHSTTKYSAWVKKVSTFKSLAKSLFQVVFEVLCTDQKFYVH